MDCFSRGTSFIVMLILAVLLAHDAAFAEPVSLPEAQQVAATFLRARAVRPAGRAAMLTAAAAVGMAPASFRAVRDDDGAIVAYVADLEPCGFVAIAANSDVAPVVAYSFRSSFPAAGDARHPLGRMLREDLRLRLRALAEDPQLKRPEVGRLWDLYTAGQGDDLDEAAFQQWPPEGTTSTGGWIETTWEQEPPYNKLCPLDPVDGERSVVGCLATALAQIMHYHRQFNISFGPDDSYMTYSGVWVDADSVLYDFPSFAELNTYLDTVRLKYREGAALDETDMAALSFACGVAVRMDYSSEGSGAPVYAARDALLDRLGFHSADLFEGVSHASHLTLQENILNGLPALVSISPPDGFGGHAIVCDGYNTRGEFHVSFGWGSSHPAEITEAWYSLPVDMPSRASVITETIVNLRPDAPLIEVDSGAMDFYGVPGQESVPQTLQISSRRAGTRIDWISSPDGFVISMADDVYGDRIDSFTIESAGEGAIVYVKFRPERAGGYYGTLQIGYNDSNSRYVVLKGWAFEGGTSVPTGDVSGTWTEPEGPYFVAGDIEVPRGRELAIEPGVKVFFTGRYGMTIGEGARLLARGNAARPIEFTAWNRQDGWAGLRFIESGDDDVLSHCLVTFARKGAVPIPQESDDPLFLDELEDTKPDSRGGAVHCAGSSPTIEHCTIANNTGDLGGAIYCDTGDPVITNTVIANNASLGGRSRCGGLHFEGPSRPQVTNCTIAHNFPGGIFSTAWLPPSVVNTIVWGNDDYQILTDESVVDVTFSDVEGGYLGEGNMDLDPCFFDATAGVGTDYDGASANWALRDFSPCVNAGAQVPGLPETDLTGGARVYGDIVDLGAYESRAQVPVMTITPAVTLDAGFVPLGESSQIPFDIVNTGSGDLELGSMTVFDSEGVFTARVTSNVQVLSAGESVRVELEFRPTEEKVYLGGIEVRSADGPSRRPGSPSGIRRRITLRGVGVSGTVVPGGSVSGTWKKADSPYTVTGDIEVPKGRTLTIEPGVVVRFAGRFGLTVGYGATLRAVGTERDRITFTATDTNEGWFGIRFYSSGTNDTLQYCILEHAKKPREGGADLPDLFGGAVFCGTFGYEWAALYTYSSPLIDSCLFRNNYARTGGAIACLDGSEATITNNAFLDNMADYDGGAITMYYANCTIANSVIARNSGLVAGGIMNFLGVPTIINNTIVSNRPSALHLEMTTTFTGFWGYSPILNNIIWNNEIFTEEHVAPEEYDIRFNDIQGGWEGEGNIDLDPAFADPANGDYHLKSQAGRWNPVQQTWVVDDVTSPGIDAGDPSSDVGDEPWPNGGRINLGAYGGTAEAAKTP